MVRFQKAQRVAVASILLAGAFVEARSQTANKQRPTTPADIAKAIADGIEANTLRSSPGALLEFESATSRGNIVVMKFIVNDFAAFDGFKSNSDKTRVALVTYWCSESRVASLRQGVVIHTTYARSDNNDRVEFTIDKSSCTTQ